MNPPLRTPADVAACVEGLRDGTIDCIATDHAPHAIQDKLCEFDAAAFGISGLETALGLALHWPCRSRTRSARSRSAPSARSASTGASRGSARCRSARRAIVAIIDPEAEWTVEPETFASKGKNTPLDGPAAEGTSGRYDTRR